MGQINVAIIGVGNCASSLVQGIHKYSEVQDNELQVPGLMHNVLGGYSIGDVNVVAAFDVDKDKVFENWRNFDGGDFSLDQDGDWEFSDLYEVDKEDMDMFHVDWGEEIK